jgi:hypothetical protein
MGVVEVERSTKREASMSESIPLRVVVRHSQGYPEVPGTEGWSWGIGGVGGEDLPVVEVMGYDTEAEARAEGEAYVNAILAGLASRGVTPSAVQWSTLSGRDLEGLAALGGWEC